MMRRNRCVCVYVCVKIDVHTCAHTLNISFNSVSKMVRSSIAVVAFMVLS